MTMLEALDGQRLPPRFVISPGHTLLLEARDLAGHRCLLLDRGLVRVALSSGTMERADGEPITLGFLQSGDSFSLDMLEHAWIHLEALDATTLVGGDDAARGTGSPSLTDWTTALLLIQHLGSSEQRLRALMQLLVERLGRRCGAWYELPVRLTHDRIAEMVNHTRVTVTKHFSRWRREGLIDSALNAEGGLRIAPRLVEPEL